MLVDDEDFEYEPHKGALPRLSSHSEEMYKLESLTNQLKRKLDQDGVVLLHRLLVQFRACVRLDEKR